MSLYPGGRKLVGAAFKNSLDTAALADSMALAIEDAMKEYHQDVKAAPLPATGEADRRLLFVAIARGVLGYLQGKQASITTRVGGNTGSADLHIDMDKP
jgi:hypothetical protein